MGLYVFSGSALAPVRPGPSDFQLDRHTSQDSPLLRRTLPEILSPLLMTCEMWVSPLTAETRGMG